MKTRFTIIAAIAITGLTGGIGHAQDKPMSVRVSYADLDVASSAGMKTLEKRVTTAAGTVCGRRDTVDLQQQAQYNKCRRTAISNAMDSFQAKNTPVYASR